MLFYSYYDSAFQILPVSPCSVSFSFCVIPVSRNPALYSLYTLSKSPPLLSFSLAASKGLVLQDVECTGYNQGNEKLLCASIVAHTNYLAYAKHFTGTWGRDAIPGVSPHTEQLVVLFSFLKLHAYFTAQGLKRSSFCRITVLKNIREVCCVYPENTLYADCTKQKASQACSQWRKGLQTGLWLKAVLQLLNKLPPHWKAEFWG